MSTRYFLKVMLGTSALSWVMLVSQVIAIPKRVCFNCIFPAGELERETTEVFSNITLRHSHLKINVTLAVAQTHLRITSVGFTYFQLRIKFT